MIRADEAQSGFACRVAAVTPVGVWNFRGKNRGKMKDVEVTVELVSGHWWKEQVLRKS